MERLYRHWRDRYTVFGNDVDTRPKRPGIAWQNLRASVALLIERFRLCCRYGWLAPQPGPVDWACLVGFLVL